jgi:hypothetical protein
MLLDERLELGDDGSVPSRGKISLDALLDTREPKLLETRDVRLRKRLVGQVGERCSTPDRESIPRAAGRGERFELVGVELARVNPKLVPRRTRRNAVAAKRLAQLRDVNLERLLRRSRRLVPPQCLDEAVDGDDTVRLHEQPREQHTLLLAAEIDDATAGFDLERAEDPERDSRLDRTTVTPA